MDIHGTVEEMADEIVAVSKKIYDYAEIGSEEFKSSSLLAENLEKNGFNVIRGYKGLRTSFRADFGHVGPTIAFLAEYDALPNGHSCGHNLIAAWAYGSAVVLSKLIKEGKIAVIGTPSEEGIGQYAASKVVLSNSGVFDDVDVVFGMHPDDTWAVGAKALASITLRLTFKGRSSHTADSPEKGINALDTAVAAYNGINALRGWAKNDKHVVIGMFFEEAGTATNVIPERAVLDVELRSSSGKFLPDLVEKVRTLAKGTSDAFGAEISIDEITPLYEEYLPNSTLDSLLEEELEKIGITPVNIDLSTDIASGSTDEANVSKVVPTGHIDVKIGKGTLSGHSDEFRDASNPDIAGENLLKAISVTVNACLRIIYNSDLLTRAVSEFQQSRGE